MNPGVLGPKLLSCSKVDSGPDRFPGSARNHRNDGKFHKSDQTLSQTIRDINKLCLGEISLQKTVRIKFLIDSSFSNVLYGKK